MLKIFQKYLNPEQYRQEQRMEAELAYRAQSRSFQRYAAMLSGTVDQFRRMAVESEHAGRHANALRAAHFTRLLENTQSRVESVRQHLDMLHAMSGASDVMVQFMESCRRLGCDLSETIDLKDLGESELQMEQGLSRLNFLSDKIEQVFETMEHSLDCVADSEEADPEDERLLAQLCGAAVEEKPSAPPVEEPVELPVQPLPESMKRTIQDLGQRLDALTN